jgi:hypothetical protein
MESPYAVSYSLNSWRKTNDVPSYSRTPTWLLRAVQKKPSILKSPALWLLIFACITFVIGIFVYSISSGDKSGGFPALLVLSICIIGFGLLLAFVSFVTGMDELFG